MATVGKRLRYERETRSTSIEEMVEATGIGQSYLDALERDAIDELPGKAFGKLYIRAYAEVFGFDPQSWIDDYDREQRLTQGASTEPTSPVPSGARPVAAAIARWKAERTTKDEPEPASAPEARPEIPIEAAVEPTTETAVAPAREPTPTARRRVSPLLLVGAVAITLVAAIYIGARITGSQPPLVPPVSESRAPQPEPPVIEAPHTPPPQEPPRVTPPAKRTPAVQPAREPGNLTVSEFGVGRRMVNHRLEGEGDRFEPGARVCFSTRVLGGRGGDVVRHVWMRDGKTEQSIPLRLGGPDWRTHSNKTLGRDGAWTVEARDSSGRVLATASFTCAPRGG